LHRSQSPSHADSQQRPSTQYPELQLASAEQLEPRDFSDSHRPVPALQKNPSSQSASFVQIEPDFGTQIPSALHRAAPSQRPGFSARTTSSHRPVSSPKHVWHGPLHALSQQNPTVAVISMQFPETQSPPELHC